jgi:hypothetical protein
MRIVYHLGVHCTDDERLVKCLLVNRAALAGEGIIVPGPARYRTLLRDTAASLQGRTASADTQQLILDEILEDVDDVKRVILSWDNFLAFPQWALRGALYLTAGARMRSITRIFPDCDAEFHLAIRNPASFLPALIKKQGGRTYLDVMDGIDPRDLFWSEMIRDLAEANPGVPIHVWCDEDTPLIWPEILQIVSGHSAGLTLEGSDNLLHTLMSANAMNRYYHLLQKRPPRNINQRRKIVSWFLMKLALPQRMEVTVDLPGWTTELAETLTLQYDQDLARIAAIPGVTLTLP